MNRQTFDKLMESASPAVKAGGKRALEKTIKVPLCHVCGGIDGHSHTCPRFTWKDSPLPKRPAIRVPKSPKLTQSEADYLYCLETEFPGCDIPFEGVTLRLPAGLYTPDFTVWRGNALLLAVEVKGRVAKNHSASRSILAFKTAASEWPCIPFRYAAKQKDGTWNITEINV